MTVDGYISVAWRYDSGVAEWAGPDSVRLSEYAEVRLILREADY
jgi:hypothetical protein